MKTYALIFSLLLFSVSLWAQPGDPGGDPDNVVPITGIEWLLGAGALLGARRFLENRKDKL